ncbi:hypothetical protein J2R98_002515 [Alkalibacillus filiformis]|uniref:Uncharacterized protein n=1 Tax=Alkalibacillus filiformis TaxID=200990 RepID=A0ABU0DW25_9BACI|nr:hypothetical protein [Alkalibacillus filiformis]
MQLKHEHIASCALGELCYTESTLPTGTATMGVAFLLSC